MKKLLTILFICLLPFLPMAQTNHYVSTTGSDTAIGTISRPWATLPYAASQVTTAGDTIQILNGTYTLTQASLIAVGVHVKGQSVSGTILKSHYKNNWNSNNPTDAAITFTSTTEGTNGNQSIQNLTLDGDNLTATSAILVRGRSNVLLKNLTIKDFYVNGVCLIAGASPYTMPTTRAVNNEIAFCTISNCTDSSSTYVGGGLINMSGQKDFSVHDCNLSDTSRAATHNGDIVVGGYYGIGFKFYNNHSYKPRPASNDWWNFHLELPNEMAGVQIHNNFFYGGDVFVDMGLNEGYDYSYDTSFSVHDNLFHDYNPTVSGTHGKYATTIEGPDVKNIYVFRNTYENCVVAFSVTDGTGGVAAKDSNIHFFENVSINTGEFDNTYYGSLIEIQKIYAGGSIDGLYIINNTVPPNSLANTSAISITNNNGCTMNNVVIANNIFTYGKNQYWLWVDNTGSTFSNLTIRNNNLFNNPNNNAANFTGNPVSNYINTGNIFTDPMFISSSDLHLQAGSPAIGAAYPYGYGSDIGGYQYVAPPPNISISANQTITVSNTSVSAVGTAASGEVITGYAWTVSSGTGTFGSPTSASTTVTGLSSGANVLRCTVTQTDGQTAYKEVTITVNFPAPTANAGANQTITLPVSSANLSGSATVAPGQTATYLWTKVSGSGTQIITGNTTLTPSVSGMTTSGDYVFQLKVTQTDNQFATSTVTVHVNPSVTPQQPYVIFPVPIKVIQLR